MRRFVSLVLTALLLFSPLLALATEPAETVTGVVCFPQGATEDNAALLLRYSYPLLTARNETDDAINAYFASYFHDLTENTVPALVEMLDVLPAEGEPPYYLNAGCTVTADTSAYLSVLLSTQQYLGNAETESVQGMTFARDGVYAGQTLTLSQLMGLEQAEDETDEVSYASRLVYDLVWRIIGEEASMRQRVFFEALTQEEFETLFSPEQDFYLDSEGNLVFYLQAGAIASDVEGVLTYPFALEELLSAVS